METNNWIDTLEARARGEVEGFIGNNGRTPGDEPAPAPAPSQKAPAQRAAAKKANAKKSAAKKAPARKRAR